jgi:hypothetical protein
VRAPVDGPGRRRGLGQGEAFELGAESIDLALELAPVPGVARHRKGAALGGAQPAGLDRQPRRGSWPGGGA